MIDEQSGHQSSESGGEASTEPGAESNVQPGAELRVQTDAEAVSGPGAESDPQRDSEPISADSVSGRSADSVSESGAELVSGRDSEPTPAERGSEPEGDQRKSSFWRELPILLGVAVVVAVLVRTFVLQTFYIPSGSMEHTLDINDRVLVNKVVYDYRSPHRGEVVVFKAPDDWRSPTDGPDFIKRVIGVGGDRVACCDKGRITVNGKPLDEKGYLFKQDGVSDPPASQEFEATVPEGRLWVMGDHRSASADSLQHFTTNGGDIMEATISDDSAIGRAFALFWPLGRATWLPVPNTFDGVPDPPNS